MGLRETVVVGSSISPKYHRAADASKRYLLRRRTLRCHELGCGDRRQIIPCSWFLASTTNRKTLKFLLGSQRPKPNRVILDIFQPSSSQRPAVELSVGPRYRAGSKPTRRLEHDFIPFTAV